jgi:hypothetical protein
MEINYTKSFRTKRSFMNITDSPNTMSFGKYLVGTLLRPRQTFNLLMADSRRVKFSLVAISINAFIYTLVYAFLSIGRGAPSTLTPWLAVPKDVYYFYNQFWLAPSMFGCWILAAGAAHLLSKLFSGQGSFEDTLSALGFGIAVATFFAILHDLPDSFLGAIGVLDLRWYEVALNSPTIWRTILMILYGTGLFMLAFLSIKGVSASQKIKGGPALFVGILAAVLYQGMFFIFNR